MNTLLVAGVLGALGVVAGAFGAHGLEGRVAPERLETWRVGVLYHLVHALALLGVAALGRAGFPGTGPAAQLFTWGTVVFSGTCYALTFDVPRWLGAITPLGGLMLVGGWLALAWAARGS